MLTRSFLSSKCPRRGKKKNNNNPCKQRPSPPPPELGAPCNFGLHTQEGWRKCLPQLVQLGNSSEGPRWASSGLGCRTGRFLSRWDGGMCHQHPPWPEKSQGPKHTAGKLPHPTGMGDNEVPAEQRCKWSHMFSLASLSDC